VSPASWQAEVEELRRLAPRHVLFLCVANSARKSASAVVEELLWLFHDFRAP
jgi:hypothetical protein